MWISVVSLCLILPLFLLGSPSAAGALDPALQQELLALYDRYNETMAAASITDAAALRSAEARAAIEQEVNKGKKAQAELIEMARQMVADSIEVLHATISRDGTEAAILTLTARTVPANAHIAGGPKPGTVLHGEITLKFKQEGKQWKFDYQEFGLDPAQVKPCSDEAIEPTSNYDDDHEVSLGGMIRKVEFKPDHTLLVVRIVDEDNCAILPNRGKLIELGMDVSKLVPYATVEMTGSPHRSDKQRAYIYKLQVLAG